VIDDYCRCMVCVLCWQWGCLSEALSQVRLRRRYEVHTMGARSNALKMISAHTHTHTHAPPPPPPPPPPHQHPPPPPPPP